MKEFYKPGFPKIKLSANSFEVCRSLEDQNCLTFQYSEIHQIEYYKMKSTLYSWFKQFLDYSLKFWYNTPKHVLVITKEDNEVWEYECDEYYNDEFAQIIITIIDKAGLQKI